MSSPRNVLSTDNRGAASGRPGGRRLMRRQFFIRWLGIFVGSIFLLAGVFETIRVLASGDGGVAFWFGTLIGGGALILFGTLRLQSHPLLALGAVTIGGLAGSLATAWTVMLPMLALLLVVLRAIGTLEARLQAL
jgi:hypothetical protein